MIAVLTANKNTFDMWCYYMAPEERNNYVMVNRTEHTIGVTFTGVIKLNDWRSIPHREVILKQVKTRIWSENNVKPLA